MQNDTIQINADHDQNSKSLCFSNKTINAEINLPSSKSISNRALIINALSHSKLEVKNLSDSDDTKVLQNALNSNAEIVDIGAAGTAMRFLTAYYAISEGERILTGCPRMKQRPISILVDALNSLGADIQYIENEGFPPLKILGRSLDGGTIRIAADVSSQYISALMMIAPCLKNGLKIIFSGKTVSAPYIQMTAAIMQKFGVRINFNDNIIDICKQKYQPTEFEVEADWSAASYCYEILSIAGKGQIMLNNLKNNSLQGDCRCVSLFALLGVATTFTPQGVIIEANGQYASEFNCDFTDSPDLVQSVVVACCMNNIKFCFDGLSTLKIKETNRVQALI
ncbi:MAG: 3-phosphoshikimate 1-carboxyvinyltransferase, partial [Paludibacter sp.]|nr:3-phosphoshikimate 1-carboxyvinyltransferase [Paludibacter sp.]